MTTVVDERMTTVVDDRALPTATPREARARMLRFLRARWPGVVGAVVLTSGATAAALAGPALVGIVVDAVANGRADAARIVDRAAIGYALLALLAAGLRYWGGVRAAVVGEGALAELRTEVFDHALGVPVDLVERAGTGDLVSRVTSDVSVLADAVRRSIPIAVFAVFEVTFTIGAPVLLDVRLAAIALITAAPIAVLAARWYFRRAHNLYRRERERHAQLAAGLHESYLGSAVLAGFRAAGRTRLGLAGRGRGALDAELATTTARNRMRPAVSVAQAVSLVAVMAVGTAMVDGGSLEIGTLSAAALYLIQLFSPVGNLLEQSDELQRSTASFARLVGVTQLPFDHHERLPEPEAATPVAVAGRASGDAGTLGVSVRDLAFGYEPEARRFARDFRIRRVAPLDGLRSADLQGAHIALIVGGS